MVTRCPINQSYSSATEIANSRMEVAPRKRIIARLVWFIGTVGSYIVTTCPQKAISVDINVGTNGELSHDTEAVYKYIKARRHCPEEQSSNVMRMKEEQLLDALPEPLLDVDFLQEIEHHVWKIRSLAPGITRNQIYFFKLSCRESKDPQKPFKGVQGYTEVVANNFVEDVLCLGKRVLPTKFGFVDVTSIHASQVAINAFGSACYFTDEQSGENFRILLAGSISVYRHGLTPFMPRTRSFQRLMVEPHSVDEEMKDLLEIITIDTLVSNPDRDIRPHNWMICNQTFLAVDLGASWYQSGLLVPLSSEPLIVWDDVEFSPYRGHDGKAWHPCRPMRQILGLLGSHYSDCLSATYEQFYSRMFAVTSPMRKLFEHFGNESWFFLRQYFEESMAQDYNLPGVSMPWSRKCHQVTPKGDVISNQTASNCSSYSLADAFALSIIGRLKQIQKLTSPKDSSPKRGDVDKFPNDRQIIQTPEESPALPTFKVDTVKGIPFDTLFPILVTALHRRHNATLVKIYIMSQGSQTPVEVYVGMVEIVRGQGSTTAVISSNHFSNTNDSTNRVIIRVTPISNNEVGGSVFWPISIISNSKTVNIREAGYRETRDLSRCSVTVNVRRLFLTAGSIILMPVYGTSSDKCEWTFDLYIEEEYTVPKGNGPVLFTIQSFSTLNASRAENGWGELRVGPGAVVNVHNVWYLGGGASTNQRNWFGHSMSQPVLRIANVHQTAVFDGGGCIACWGKCFGIENSYDVHITNFTISECDTGMEVHHSNISLSHTAITNLPWSNLVWQNTSIPSNFHYSFYSRALPSTMSSDDDYLTSDKEDDNDGIYLRGDSNGNGVLHKAEIQAISLYNIGDDAIDINGHNVTIGYSWIALCGHEGIATSGYEGAAIHIFGTVIMNCAVGLEIGYGSPTVIFTDSQLIKNNYGIRFGDEYIMWEKEGVLTMSHSSILSSKYFNVFDQYPCVIRNSLWLCSPTALQLKFGDNVTLLEANFEEMSWYSPTLVAQYDIPHLGDTGTGYLRPWFEESLRRQIIMLKSIPAIPHTLSLGGYDSKLREMQPPDISSINIEVASLYCGPDKRSQNDGCGIRYRFVLEHNGSSLPMAGKSIYCQNMSHYDSESHLRQLKTYFVDRVLQTFLVVPTRGTFLPSRIEQTASRELRSQLSCLKSHNGNIPTIIAPISPTLRPVNVHPSTHDELLKATRVYENFWEYITFSYIANCLTSVHNHFAVPTNRSNIAGEEMFYLVALDNDRCLMPQEVNEGLSRHPELQEHQMRFRKNEILLSTFACEDWSENYLWLQEGRGYIQAGWNFRDAHERPNLSEFVGRLRMWTKISFSEVYRQFMMESYDVLRYEAAAFEPDAILATERRISEVNELIDKCHS